MNDAAAHRKRPVAGAWPIRLGSVAILAAGLVLTCRLPPLAPLPPLPPRTSAPASAPFSSRSVPVSSPGSARWTWQHVEDFSLPLAQFQSVFWEPQDTESLRKLIRETPLVRDQRVLEIGTGTGLIALCCLQARAQKVVATDINPAAVANARYNARQLGLAERLETRLVPLESSSAFSVVAEGERFDLILSNPPWENAAPRNISEYALYDEGFQLMHSLLAGLPQHLAPDGKVLLAYGCVSAIRELLRLAADHGYEVQLLDDRSLDALPELFLPGMLIEIRLPAASPSP